MRIIPLDNEAKVIYSKNILLKIVENPQSEVLLDNNSAKKLLSIPNLCHEEIRILVDKLVEKDGTLTLPSFVKSLLRFGKKIEAIEEFDAFFSGLSESLRKTGFVKRIESSMEKSMEKSVKEEFESMDSAEKERLRSNFISNFGLTIPKEQLISNSAEMATIDKELEKTAGFGLLASSKVDLCPNCDIVFNENVFDTCVVCGKTPNKKTAKTVTVSRLPEPIGKIWLSNLWFEAFFSRLLRNLGWKKNWINIHILGSSGMMHEIDILAIRNGIVLVSECKTGKVSRKDVFNFWAKLSDIKAHYGILALLRDLPEPETREFIKKKPTIICLEKMGRMKEADITTRLAKELPS